MKGVFVSLCYPYDLCLGIWSIKFEMRKVYFKVFREIKPFSIATRKTQPPFGYVNCFYLYFLLVPGFFAVGKEIDRDGAFASWELSLLDIPIKPGLLQ